MEEQILESPEEFLEYLGARVPGGYELPDDSGNRAWIFFTRTASILLGFKRYVSVLFAFVCVHCVM